jgi:hypothetical protein
VVSCPLRDFARSRIPGPQAYRLTGQHQSATTAACMKTPVSALDSPLQFHPRNLGTQSSRILVALPLPLLDTRAYHPCAAHAAWDPTEPTRHFGPQNMLLYLRQLILRERTHQQLYL